MYVCMHVGSRYVCMSCCMYVCMHACMYGSAIFGNGDPLLCFVVKEHSSIWGGTSSKKNAQP